MSVRLRADDRVLLLAIPSHRELAAMAGMLTDGSLVALGTADEVDAGRTSLAGLDNVLFVNAAADSIPWRDAYFTKILVPSHLRSLVRSAFAELGRVLAPGGEIAIDEENC